MTKAFYPILSTLGSIWIGLPEILNEKKREQFKLKKENITILIEINIYLKKLHKNKLFLNIISKYMYINQQYYLLIYSYS